VEAYDGDRKKTHIPDPDPVFETECIEIAKFFDREHHLSATHKFWLAKQKRRAI
jgi:hypothetical protein